MTSVPTMAKTKQKQKQISESIDRKKEKMTWMPTQPRPKINKIRNRLPSAHLIVVVYGTIFSYTTTFYIYNYFFPYLTEISEIWIILTIVYDVQELY